MTSTHETSTNDTSNDAGRPAGVGAVAFDILPTPVRIPRRERARRSRLVVHASRVSVRPACLVFRTSARAASGFRLGGASSLGANLRRELHGFSLGA